MKINLFHNNIKKNHLPSWIKLKNTIIMGSKLSKKKKSYGERETDIDKPIDEGLKL